MERLQLILRDWGEPGSDIDAKVAASTCLHLAYGLLEVPAGTLAEDLQVPVSFDVPASTIRFGEPSRVRDEWGASDHAACGEVTSWLTTSVWKGPVSPLPPGVLAGQAIARRCAAETAPGREAFLLVGILSSTGPVPAGRLSRVLEGIGEMGTGFGVAPGGREIEFEAGARPSWIYNQPVWAWGAEPVGFMSTLRLELQDGLDRLRPLIVKETLTKAEEAEIKAFQDESGRAMETRDKDYLRFLRLTLEADPDREETRRPRTAAEFARRDVVSKVAIRAMMQGDDDEAILAAVREALSTDAAAPAHC
jgi:hypothetical protein